MKNADTPAMPTITYDHGAAMQGLAVSVTDATGLTKRETMFMHVIGHVLAAHLNPMREQMGYRHQDNEEIVRRAVEIVDLGLAELGRTK
ncbi:hypothetical protein [Aeromonas caviae]